MEDDQLEIAKLLNIDYTNDYKEIASKYLEAIPTTIMKSGIFHAVINLAELMFKDLNEMFWIPSVGEKFLVTLSEGIFRAVRILSEVKVQIKLWLMDTGEIIIMNNVCKCYEMPHNMKDIPPKAICMKLDKIINDNIEDPETYLESKLYDILKLEVVDVNQYYVTVCIINQKEKKEFSITNYDREILFEKTMETPSIDKVTLGYDLKENSVCTKTNSDGVCFKRGHCRRIHLSENIDNWWNHKREIFFNSEIYHYPVPNKNETRQITILNFIDVNKFYCYDIQLFKRNELSILQRHMNNPEEIQNYVEIEDILEIDQLVVVCVNKTYHRARVARIHSQNDVEVILVDFGFAILCKLNKKEIFNWMSKFSNLPFQAISMEIENLKRSDKFNSNPVKYISFFQKWTNIPLTVEIRDNIGSLIVRLFDKDYEIGDEIIKYSLAVPGQIHVAFDVDQCNPG